MNTVTKNSLRSARDGLPLIVGLCLAFILVAVVAELATGGTTGIADAVEGVFAVFVYVLPAYIGVITTAHAVLEHQ
jgi:hypothetical protein